VNPTDAELAARATVPRTLSRTGKAVYASGDLTVNTALSALSLVYATYFLVQIADLRPLLAGLIPLIGRAVDAFTDPLMGRISDRTRLRAGRRRPWFLIGAVPFGLSFALMWAQPPFASEWARFAFYAGAYCLMTMSMTVLSVPYLALLPEIALGYDARTSLNTWRTVGATLGVFAAVGIRPVAEAFGGGPAGFATAGVVYGIALALPWLGVYRATFERPELHLQQSEAGFFASIVTTFRHRSFMRLVWLYIMGRIAMDLAAALLILYVSFWLGRSGDFELLMLLFLGAVVVALPCWLRIARGRDKAVVFVAGSLWWMGLTLCLAFVQPDWPRWLLFAYVPLMGFGFAVVDLMPWSMVGEVIDEDEAETGERREGLYNGMFTFLRKLGGGIGVFLVLGLLDLFGYERRETQSETARQAIRWMTACAPPFFLFWAIWFARGYPLTRARHHEIQTTLADRDAARQQARRSALTTEASGSRAE
jgi:sugar (glycoside-pentoside-hexuronide) transporter